MKRIVSLALLLIAISIIVVSCKHEYIYLLYSHDSSKNTVITGDVIKAQNDSIAYAKAFEKFCNSVYEKKSYSLRTTTPDEFVLRDKNNNEVKPISDSVLSIIEKKVIAWQQPHLNNPSSNNNSTYSSTNSTSRWKDRMETDEYKASLAREVMLKQAGMKDAAKIERAQRNQYLRGGGYDSKDGGKQVHYNGSAQQQRDLDAIDKYMREHPDF